jgi:hypothetical protein
MPFNRALNLETVMARALMSVPMTWSQLRATTSAIVPAPHPRSSALEMRRRGAEKAASAVVTGPSPITASPPCERSSVRT